MSGGVNGEFLDKSMDDALKMVEGLNWLPWVGASYRDADKRLLILGESTYNRGKSHNERLIAEERLADKNNLRRIHEKYALTGKGESQFSRNLEKAVYRKKRVSRDERESFWSSVMYNNLVLEAMPRIKV